ncbi:MAG: flagellar export chaperone FliS [Candidatus Omnitrophica bacterium]|jgi:flagellar protein FliS|nr:flagellar export chaperone FliS [bacterium]MBW7937773.1 flagellar export chaperone FliS [Candidatus Omnitrophota bacterium]MBV6480704.1 hypothetical protein [bacterium]MCC6731681.1 flagellar export chaperone FliS [Candidatus Omnitrophota bacterium]MCK6496258.1 flagellar export chaperone FliS [bacterium]
MNALATKAHLHYQKTQVESADPAKLILMLYDGAIRKLTIALNAHAEQDLSTFRGETTKVQRILTELMAALDHSRGGDLALNLARLYDYMIRQLFSGMLKSEPSMLLEVRTLLGELRSGWQEAIDKIREEGAAAADDARVADAPSPVPMMGQPAPGLMPTLNIAG